MTVLYDSRFVPAHGRDFHAQVLLMNEAPGPDEAVSGVPLYGQQGANLFHALRAAGIVWAANFGKFIWPRNDRNLHGVRQRKKRSFLATRAQYITCTNAFPYWPKPSDNIDSFCPPLKEDVCGIENIERIKGEILGFVRKVCSQATVYARQAYHGPEATGQFVVSRADPA